MHAVATLHSERSQHLAEIIHREMDKSVDEAVGEVEFSASIYRYYAENAETFLTDEPIELLEGQGTAVVRRRPVDVLLGIMPWNYPYGAGSSAASSSIPGRSGSPVRTRRSMRRSGRRRGAQCAG
ncbi:aldehyde dehydrogenase family protein [Streptomyces sindenensis]|uniref:Aldehyde dehydrogenase family protein n=1 Tax=Streptomyces sindenensis TaxID=67363 RepID=A0ABW6EMQ3_9ACTN